MRRAVLASAIAFLAACGQPQQEAPPPVEEIVVRVPPPWFICDGINEPAVFVFNRNGENVQVAEYEKPSGAIVQRNGYYTAEEGAAGSIYYDLWRDAGPGGDIRQLNPGALETPGSAYTPVFTSVELDRREINCRWMPRTRVLGFTGRRSFVVHEDASGDLVYTAYNFADADRARPIELSENGRTTTPFSVEVRDGAETQTPQGVTYTFETQDFRYVVQLNRDGTGALDVSRDGVAMQSEPLIGYQQGTAQAQAEQPAQ
ncbi:MAG TPA: hypothetical protein VEA80_10280 [Vitreimonas sp.]|uniref:hypothetical protein n=1 Tax=Vitreimonas sp. TaxID=3069702 RepID=UPI002D4FC612|nr:hypothetical protein [Vitreimonas sp.]HYD87852.1 hypothetical protein [Vitreimonas sp.]